MKKTYDTESMNNLWRILTPEKMADSLDSILFTATVSYLDPDRGCPTEQNVEDVTNVRILLETLRECCKSSK